MLNERTLFYRGALRCLGVTLFSAAAVVRRLGGPAFSFLDEA
jgi:hypothetical protein